MQKEEFNMSQKIQEAGKETPYQVPDKYFDTLPQIIQERVIDSKQWNPLFIFSYFTQTRYWLSASFALLLITGGMIFYSIPNKQQTDFDLQTAMGELSHEDIVEALSDENLHEEQLVNLVVETSYQPNTHKDTNHIDQELYDNIDESLIIEEL